MKTFSTVLLALAMTGLAGSLALADEKIDKTKLVGKWKMVKIDGNVPPVDVIMEFTKDGKLTISYEKDGKTGKVDATYSVENDKLTVTNKKGDSEEKNTETVTMPSADKLVITKSDGKKAELEKVK